ncbi:MAG: WxL protein peptidoglycan domain-containing protein, partial [Weissella cibaria]
MKKMTWLAFAVGVGAVTLSGTTIHAAQADLNVTPVQAASQRDKSESFFDLVLQPNQSENLSVKLQNTTKKDMVVDAQAAPAST